VSATFGGTAIGTFSYQRRPEAAGPPVRLRPRLTLAGREPLLDDLDARLSPDPGRPGPQVVVLCGLGGVGKTSVAVEFAYRQLGGVGVCWQFSAEDPAVLAAEFSVLAAELGAREVVDPRNPVASVHAVLARQAAGWLVVLDNAADLASVEAFIPPAGPGRVIITSQSQHWRQAGRYTSRNWTSRSRRSSWWSELGMRTSKRRWSWLKGWAGCRWR
jgi:hypothetical protein